MSKFVSNQFVAFAVQPILDYLCLRIIDFEEIRIDCDCKEMPKVMGAMRPRVDMRGGHPHVHTHVKHQNAMKHVSDTFVAECGLKHSDFSGPVVMCVTSNRHVPKSWPKRRIGEQDISKPDASNILKLVEDALNGIAYKDDSQIVASIPIKARRFRETDFIDVVVLYCEDRNA